MPLVSHESFVEKDAATNNFFAVHLDFSRAAKSKTNEGYMNHLVSWLLFWLPYLWKIFPVPTFFVPFLSTLIKDNFSHLTLYLSSFKATQTGDFWEPWGPPADLEGLTSIALNGWSLLL